MKSFFFLGTTRSVDWEKYERVLLKINRPQNITTQQGKAFFASFTR